MQQGIVHLQVGGLGNLVGCGFWQNLCVEYSLNKTDGSLGRNAMGISTYFQEIAVNQYQPRAVLVDTESDIVDGIFRSDIGNLFHPEQRVTGSTSRASGNWARGFYSEGSEFIDDTIDLVRKQAERCEYFQGVQMIHYSGGGTGGGLGSHLLVKLREQFPNRILSSINILPSNLIGGNVIKPYSATLSLNYLTEYADVCVCIDEVKVWEIYYKTFRKQQPMLANLPDTYVPPLINLAGLFGFPSSVNSDLRRFATNMVPFPRLKYLLLGHSPISGISCKNEKELINSVFRPSNVFMSGKLEDGKILSSSLIFRGVSKVAVEEHITSLSNDISNLFVPWIPDNLLVSHPSFLKNQLFSATSVHNTTAIQGTFRWIFDGFKAIFQRKAFLHYYIQEGMEEQEFIEAINNFDDLFNEYQKIENCNN